MVISHVRFAIVVLGIAVFCGAPRCHAAFTSLWFVNYQCEAPGLRDHTVWRVYAEFSDPADRLVSVFGSAASPLTITSTGGFYQHPLGGNTAPQSAVVAVVPEVEWDTFCTIGVAVNTGSDLTTTSPGFALPAVNNTSIAWFVPASGHEQGAPNYSGKVLIAQLTLLPGSFISGFSAGLTYRPAGSPTSVTVNHISPVLLPLTAGDLNHDLQVNMDDLLLVVGHWQDSGPGIPDANDDRVVDIDDLLIVVSNWGLFPGSCP